MLNVSLSALLTGTLRTFQRAGCDNDIVTLKCPAGTSISVQIAQYGKSASSKGLCPKSTATSISTTTNNDPDISEPTDCLLPDSIQVSISNLTIFHFIAHYFHRHSLWISLNLTNNDVNFLVRILPCIETKYFTTLTTNLEHPV